MQSLHSFVTALLEFTLLVVSLFTAFCAHPSHLHLVHPSFANPRGSYAPFFDVAQENKLLAKALLALVLTA